MCCRIYANFFRYEFGKKAAHFTAAQRMFANDGRIQAAGPNDRRHIIGVIRKWDRAGREAVRAESEMVVATFLRDHQY
jgi:hypothetical protein